jgi:hypothetical protein
MLKTDPFSYLIKAIIIALAYWINEWLKKNNKSCMKFEKP